MKSFVAHVGGIGAHSRHEAIVRIEEMSVEQVKAVIGRGDITDAATLGVYLQAKLQGHV